MRDPLVRVPLIWTSIAAVALVLAAAVVRIGSVPSVVLAWLVVVITLGITLGARTWTARRDPILVMGVALLLYGGKVLVLGVLLVVLWQADWLDATVFALATVGLVLVWMLGLIVAAQRGRTAVYDLGGTSDDAHVPGPDGPRT